MDILLTWVGARDPAWLNPRTRKQEAGPILSLLRSRRFDVVYLLLNLYSKHDDFKRRATGVQRACQRYFPSLRVRQRPLDLVSVTDYQEIFRVAHDVCQSILDDQGREGREYFVYLSPGTPQMQTIWILLVQSGLLPARMIEATPPDLLTPTAPRWREVDLSLPHFPQIVRPDETARLLGVLQTQNDNLMAENRSLRAEVKLLRAESRVPPDGAIGEGFRLRDYLTAQERALYARALKQAKDNAADAARLLGIEPAAYRARATTLGVRPRRRMDAQ
jgi:two-component system response regulator AtoC